MSLNPQTCQVHQLENLINFGRAAERSNGLYRIVDPTIENMQDTFALRDFASFELE